MKKLILAAMATATLCSGVAMAQRVIAAPKVTPRPAAYTTSCTTPGDALGGLQIISIGNKLTIRESAMSGETLTYTATLSPNDINAMRLGLPLMAPFFTPKANVFGGAVSPATLLTLTGKPKGGQRSGFLARKDIVYFLNCQGPF